MSEKRKICITTDCVCDLPDEMLKEYNVDVVYFYIETDSGRFRDVNEITAQNIFEYLKNGGQKSMTTAPLPNEFIDVFTKKLKENDEVIHIATGSSLSACVKNSKTAVEQMGPLGERVHIFDSGHLSTGIGHIVIKAVEMVRNGVDDSGRILSEKICVTGFQHHLWRTAQIIFTVTRGFQRQFRCYAEFSIFILFLLCRRVFSGLNLCRLEAMKRVHLDMSTRS